MSNTKVTSHVIANNAISASMIQSAAVTDAKLHSTLDLSGKTLTLPATAIPSASTATTQAASDNSTKLATTAYVTTAIANLNDSAPAALNTLNELAAALGDDANFSSTVTTSIAAKLPLAGGTMTGDLILGDNVRIELGSASGGDLQIYHDGNNSIISDEGNGGLFLRGSNTVDIQSALGHNYLKSTLGAGTKIYYNNTEKFETTDYGASTTGTGAFKLPVGTTGQRPTAVTGQLRFNSTDGKLEVYNGSAWANVSAGTSNKTLDTFTGDGSTTAFTLTDTPANEDALIVFIDGAYQEKGDYSLSGRVLTLDVAPLSGEKIAVHTTTGAVHDGTSAVNQQFTGDGSTTAFTLSSAPGSENNTQIYINGVYQQKTDYIVSGTTLTFDTAPSNGDIIEVNMFTVTNLGNSDQVTEGVGNLYHTSARAISAISAGNLTGLTVDTTTLVVDASNNRVGIGTTSPGVELDVRGEIAVGYDATYGLRFYNQGRSNWSSIGNFKTDSTADLNFKTGGGLTMTMTHAKNVGIGTTNPAQLLEVSGNGTKSRFTRSGSSGQVMEFFAGATQAGGIGVSGSTLAIGGGSNENNINIDSAGNVGIGNSSPGHKLDISGANTDQVRFNSFRILSNTEAAGAETNIMHNTTYNSGLKHVVADESSLIQFINGEINLKHTTTGTAGGAASFVTSVAAKPHGRVEVVAPELHGASDGTYAFGGKYVGGSANDWANSAMFMTPTITAGSGGSASSQFLTVYTSGHWGEYAVFKIKVYETYYHSNYREYLARCMSTTGQLQVVTQYGSTTFFGHNAPTVSIGSAVDTGTDHSGQNIYRYDFTLTGSGAYYRTHCIVEILYGANRYYSSAISTSTLDGYNNGGKYHFKTLSAAEMKGKQIQ